LNEADSPKLSYNDAGDIVVSWIATINNKKALQNSEKKYGLPWTEVNTISPWEEEISDFDIHLDSKGVISIWWTNGESNKKTIQWIQKPIGEVNFEYDIIPSKESSEVVILSNGNICLINSDLIFSKTNSSLSITKSLGISEYTSPQSLPKTITLTDLELALDHASIISNHGTHTYCVWTNHDHSLNCSWYRNGQWSSPENLGSLPNTSTVIHKKSGFIDRKGNCLLAIPLFDETPNKMRFFVTSFSEGVFSSLQEIGHNEYAVNPNCSINHCGDSFVVWNSVQNKLAIIKAAYKSHNQKAFNLINTTNLKGDNYFPIVRCASKGNFVIVWNSFEENEEGTTIASLWGSQFSTKKQTFSRPTKLFSKKTANFLFTDFFLTEEDRGLITWTVDDKIQVAEIRL